MSGAREDILGAIRKAVDAAPFNVGRGPNRVDKRLADHARNLTPKRGQLDPEGRVQLFKAEAERVSATVDRVKTVTDVPGAIARYLAERNLPCDLRLASHPLIRRVPWKDHPMLNVAEGMPSPDDAVSVTSAFLGVAETGSLVQVSSAHTANSLNLLPPTHVVVLPAARIVGAYEGAFHHLRTERAGKEKTGFMPRALTWITGPSRTADLEQTLLLGAHGPQRLHIVIVDE